MTKVGFYTKSECQKKDTCTFAFVPFLKMVYAERLAFASILSYYMALSDKDWELQNSRIG